MNDEQVKDLRGKKVGEITALIPELSRSTLVAILAAEADDAQPRVQLTRALAAAIEAIDAEDGPPAPESPPPRPPWQAETYDGPLDIAQAEWRGRNIKPVGEVIAK